MAKIPVKRFIKTYMRVAAKGGTQTTVADMLGCTPANVCIRLKRLQTIGVRLPKLQGRKKSRYDATELNRYVAECR